MTHLLHVLPRTDANTWYTLHHLAKHTLQELCRKNYGWVEEVPRVLRQQSINWLTDLKGLSVIQVSRCLKPNDFGPPVHAQLHHFADPSEGGYDTVTYLRLQNEPGDVHVSYLLGIARVTPLKPVTIPRLELTATIVAVQVVKMVKAELQLRLEESFFLDRQQHSLEIYQP